MARAWWAIVFWNAWLVLRQIVVVALAMVLMWPTATRATANDATLDPDDWPGATLSAKGLADPNFESWVGAEGFRNVWSLYSGVTAAPFGSVRDPGLRLRAVAGVSGYRYTAAWYNPATMRGEPLAVRGMSISGEALAGYLWRSGRLSVKAFVGAAYIKHQLGPADGALANPADYNTDLNGARWGGKVAVETWLNLTPHIWASLDLAMASMHWSTNARARLGYRVTSSLSLGAEAAAFAYRDYDYFRDRRVLATTTKLGAFVRYDNGLNEFSVSGGWLDPRGSEGSVYLNAQWLTRF